MNKAIDLPSLAERVARKRRVLEGWKKDGVPVEKLSTLPRSLRDARVWRDDELGLHPIGSPNEFTTLHPQWGKEVEGIQDLIRALLKRYRTEKAKPASEPAPQPTQDFNVALAVLTRENETLIRQWNEARLEAAEYKSRAESSEARLARKQAVLAEVRAELAALKRQLERKTQLRLVR